MVTVRRQVPPAQTAQVQAPAGSMLADAVDVGVLREEKVKMCFYGINRSGKTTLAAEFAEHHGPVLFISTEPDACGGAGSIGSKRGIKIQRISHKFLGQDKDGRWMDADDKRCVRRDRLKGSDKLLALLQELAGQHPFKTVVFDTITSYQELCLVEIMGWDAPPAMHPKASEVGKSNYQYRAERWRKNLTPLLDLTNCHVILLAQQKDHNPPMTESESGKSFPDMKAKLLGNTGSSSFIAPAVGSSNAQWIADNCSYIVQLFEAEVQQRVEIPQFDGEGRPADPIIEYVGTGKRQRHLRLTSHPNYAAGGRWDFDRSIPEFITASTPKELYSAMAALIPALAPSPAQR